MQYQLLITVLLVVAAIIVARRYVQRVVIFEYERGVLFRRGVFARVLDPGIYWYLTTSTAITRLDIRPRDVSVSGQEILSADNVSLKLSVAARYAITEPYRSIASSQNYHESLYLIVQLALRTVVSSVKIDDLLARREAIGAQVLAIVAPQAEELGLQVMSAQIKDITFPGDLKRMFAQVVKAQKEGLAALEKARGESAALRNLANAARMLDNNPSLLQLRALLAASESTGSTVVVTVPPAASDPASLRRRANVSESEEQGETNS